MIVTILLVTVVTSIPLAAAALSADRLLTLRRCPRRYVWTAALSLAVLLPLVAPWRTSLFTPSGHGAVSVLGPAQETWLVESAMTGATAWRHKLTSHEDALVVGWSLMSMATGLFYVSGLLVLHRQRRGWRRHRLADTDVLVSRSIGPAVIGVLRPRLVVPHWVLSLDAATVGFVLRHEREHIHAGDPWLAHASLMATVVMPWNPMVWWMMRRLRLAIEIDCDARVLAATAESHALQGYGHVLLTLAERVGRSPILPLAAMVQPGSAISRRLSAMTAPPPRRPRTQGAVAALAAAAGLLAACTAGVPPTRTDSDEFATERTQVREGRGDGPAAETRGSEVIELGTSNLVQPRALFRPRPSFTSSAMREKIQGTVWLEGVVTPEGRMRDVKVVRSLDPDHGLDASAVSAARQWEFEPGRIEGRPVPVRVNIEMEFLLR